MRARVLFILCLLSLSAVTLLTIAPSSGGPSTGGGGGGGGAVPSGLYTNGGIGNLLVTNLSLVNSETITNGFTNTTLSAGVAIIDANHALQSQATLDASKLNFSPVTNGGIHAFSGLTLSNKSLTVSPVVVVPLAGGISNCFAVLNTNGTLLFWVTSNSLVIVSNINNINNAFTVWANDNQNGPSSLLMGSPSLGTMGFKSSEGAEYLGINSAGNADGTIWQVNGPFGITELAFGPNYQGLPYILKFFNAAGGRAANWTVDANSNSCVPNLIATNGVNIMVTSNWDGAQQGTNSFVYTVPTGVTNRYEVGGYINVTAIATDVIQAQVSFTDRANTTQTFYLMSSGVSTTGFNPIPTQEIEARSGTVITVSNVLTTGIGSITYDAHAFLRLINSR